jgi:hypothetical protein
LEPVAGCEPSAVDELLASGLVTGDSAALRFRHEIARLAVEQSVPAHRRARIHLRVLETLRGLGCDVPRRVRR